MRRPNSTVCFAILALGLIALGLGRPPATAKPGDYHSPLGLALSPDTKTLYVADQTANALVFVDTTKGAVAATMGVTDPRAVVLSPDGKTAYVTSGNDDRVHRIDLARKRVVASAPTGRCPVGLALAPDGKTVYVCCQFSDDVWAFETSKLVRAARIPAVREPRYAAVTPDGKTLVVANHLPLGSNLDESLGAGLSLIGLGGGPKDVVQLSRGATDVGQVVISRDGRYAYVPHVLARWLVPPTQLERGWVSTNALTVVDLQTRQRLNTVLLDDLDRGAANPWAAALSPDGTLLYTTHAGTNEVQIIDTAKLHKLIAEWPADSLTALEDDLTAVYRAGVRKRVPCGGIGPRAVAATADGAYVANYFSGDITRLSAALPPPLEAPAEGAAAPPLHLLTPEAKVVQTIALGRQPEADAVRNGEKLFHDATICFQGWQSCATCHPEGRTDGLAWDLLNDGIGNPKSAKSLLLSDQTPPAMAHGVRASMEVAVAAGFKYILFHVPTEQELHDTGEYIKSLMPVRSPARAADGSLSAAAKRGKAIFERADTACATCHPAPLYTDLKSYDVGTKHELDSEAEFDTPTLVEIFRTGPWLHDGSAVTLEQCFRDFNREDKHGKTSQLTDAELSDLVEFLRSL